MASMNAWRDGDEVAIRPSCLTPHLTAAAAAADCHDTDVGSFQSLMIYKLQYEGQAFKDVASLLSAMSKEMLRMTQMSTTDWLIEQGFSSLTINELVMSALQCNYGQTPEMHAFVGRYEIQGILVIRPFTVRVIANSNSVNQYPILKVQPTDSPI
ncbi:Prenylcysteine oxidase-like [Portunus trituberculatus]|uniref:Prenylcysteine oxidase-like n=1 Tax=Portunus trituberculatus TaxID=210409 RepID=A0A5B7DM31_PORTR|nr:Prenylcysteine oxidase-like [Portunus trituberculatus]